MKRTAASRARAEAGPVTITLERARAHWHRRQGLASPVKGKVEDVVAAHGVAAGLWGAATSTWRSGRACRG